MESRHYVVYRLCSYHVDVYIYIYAYYPHIYIYKNAGKNPGTGEVEWPVNQMMRKFSQWPGLLGAVGL